MGGPKGNQRTTGRDQRESGAEPEGDQGDAEGGIQAGPEGGIQAGPDASKEEVSTTRGSRASQGRVVILVQMVPWGGSPFQCRPE